MKNYQNSYQYLSFILLSLPQKIYYYHLISKILIILINLIINYLINYNQFIIIIKYFLIVIIVIIIVKPLLQGFICC